MKRLILVRHGKSSWKTDVPDDQRPLKKRGYRDAELVSNAFFASEQFPLNIWTSYAERALTTAQLFKEKLVVPEGQFEVKKELYTFNPSQLIKTIQTCRDDVDNLMVFGHNPAMTHAVNLLGDLEFDNIPTTGLTLIEFETDSWKYLKEGKTTLYLFPKNLR